MNYDTYMRGTIFTIWSWFNGIEQKFLFLVLTCVAASETKKMWVIKFACRVCLPYFNESIDDWVMIAVHNFSDYRDFLSISGNDVTHGASIRFMRCRLI